MRKFNILRKVCYISDAPKKPRQRITINSTVIKNTKNIYVLAEGARKGAILAYALKFPKEKRVLPVRLTIGRNWVLDEKAKSAFEGVGPKNLHGTRIIYA